MPTVGLEYRYPFIAVQSWGTQTIEPIAQVIVRPNETEHRQAAERGLAKPDLRRHQPVPRRQVRRLGPHRRRRPRQRRRAIHRRSSTAAASSMPCSASPITCSARTRSRSGDNTNTGLDSGLDTNRSDYVARAAVPAGPRLVVHHPLPLRRGHVSKCGASRPKPARASTAGRLRCCTASTTPSRSSASWSGAKASSAAARSSSRRTGWRTPRSRYDLDAHEFAGTSFGIGYIDDCLIVALNYMRNYTYSGVATRDDRIMLQMTLRTLGGTSVSQTVSSGPAGL